MTAGPRAPNDGQHIQGRSIKVRQVFAELRRALGSDIPAGELLRLAAALVDATTPIESRDQHRSVGPQPACDQLPLDKAWEDDPLFGPVSAFALISINTTQSLSEHNLS